MNYRLIAVALSMALLTTFSLACSGSDSKLKEKGPAATQTQVEPGQKPVSREAWQTEWERTISATRKESKVVIAATSLVPNLREVSGLIKDKYGLSMELISRRGGELMTTLLAERRAGIFSTDVLMTGMNTYFGVTKPEKLAEPLEPVLLLPEILEPKNWYGGAPHWGDKERRSLNIFAYPSAILAVNTEQVKSGEIASYYDMLNPKWKGKLIMNDPTVTGAGLNGFSVLGFGILNLDFFRQLAKLEPVVTRDQRLMIVWLAQGKSSMAMFPHVAIVNEFIETGSAIAINTPREGTHVSRDGGSVSLLNRAPHPSAARVIINWVFSKEGLAHISRSFGVQSARTDIPTEGINPASIRQPGVKYLLDADTEEWIARDQEYKNAAMEIFGPLIK